MKQTKPRAKTNRKKSRASARVDTRPTFARKLILMVIVLAIVLVVIMVACTILLNSERVTKGTIEGMAKDYYENFLYPSVAETSGVDGVAKYEKRGFTSVALRQLLFYDGQKNADKAEAVLKYCDENGTKLRFYPDAPFGKSDYHIEYTYDCEF